MFVLVVDFSSMMEAFTEESGNMGSTMERERCVATRVTQPCDGRYTVVNVLFLQLQMTTDIISFFVVVGCRTTKVPMGRRTDLQR